MFRLTIAVGFAQKERFDIIRFTKCFATRDLDIETAVHRRRVTSTQLTPNDLRPEFGDVLDIILERGLVWAYVIYEFGTELGRMNTSSNRAMCKDPGNNTPVVD
jgi:hypothetical protein